MAKIKLFVITVLILTCFNIPRLYASETATSDKQLIFSHRGSNLAVENTLESILAAIKLGTDYVEIDVLLSMDNIPVVIHDPNLQRLTGIDAWVYNLTAEQLKTFTLQQEEFTGTIPTLEEVVRACKGKVKLLIDLKCHAREQADLADKVAEIINKYDFKNECKFQSMSHELIRRLKSKQPDYNLGYIIYEGVDLEDKDTYNGFVSSISSGKINFLSVEGAIASAEVINLCKAYNMPVYIWTLNSEEEITEFLNIGASGIITGTPENAVKIRNEHIQDMH